MTLDELAADWLAAKGREQDANEERVNIETQILAQINDVKEEGRSTTNVGGYKITAIGRMTYKADFDALELLMDEWPDEFPIIKIDFKLDEPKLKKLREFRPDLWRKIAPAMTIKPAKTGVVVEQGEDNGV
jgi:hypothetical protein